MAGCRRTRASRSSSTQSNDLSQGAWQSQRGGSGSWGGDGQSQSIRQYQRGSNSIDQIATARSYAINASPNVAILNFGSVDQQSGAWSEAIALNANESSQSNTLDEGAGKRQSRGGH